ncbi:MAG: hypothetical protein SGJ05_00600 [bacterium]|nr:hypothetical protein [bacterium]
MLRTFIIVLIVVLVPLGIYLAVQYGTPAELTFAEAVSKAATTAEGDMAPKVVVIATVTRVEPDTIFCLDKEQKEFPVSYTGAIPGFAFEPNTSVKFVGHVHAGTVQLFHATQAYKP